MTISVKSPIGKIDGFVTVPYKAGKLSVVTVSGAVTAGTSGMVAQLYAQPFPYKTAAVPVPGQQLVLNGSTPESYSFTNAPGIATRYSVEILPSTTLSTPVAAKSVSATVWIVTNQSLVTKPATCGRPVCHLRIRIYTRLPASAYKAESRKKLYFYWAQKLSATGEPRALLRWLYLRHSVTISRAKRISSTEFEQTVTFSFRINNDGYEFSFNFCSKATESADGVNLPGKHHCGARRVFWAWGYLG